MSVCSAVPGSFAKERSSQQVVPERTCKACAAGPFLAGADGMSQCSMPCIALSVAVALAGADIRAQRTLQTMANDCTLVNSSNRIDHVTLRLIVATVSMAGREVQIPAFRKGTPSPWFSL